jgi:hypothetical protein
VEAEAKSLLNDAGEPVKQTADKVKS